MCTFSFTNRPQLYTMDYIYPLTRPRNTQKFQVGSQVVPYPLPPLSYSPKPWLPGGHPGSDPLPQLAHQFHFHLQTKFHHYPTTQYIQGAGGFYANVIYLRQASLTVEGDSRSLQPLRTTRTHKLQIRPTRLHYARI